MRIYGTIIFYFQQKYPILSFSTLNLHPEILLSLEEAGYTQPTPIQTQAIPPILEGKDVRASADTGTGKTAAFLLPLLHRLAQNREKNNLPKVLILLPTRELAVQVANEASKYAKYLKIKNVCIYGGIPFPIQKRALSRPYDILIATPGRLIDHIERGRIDLSCVETLILDEADRMLDMGFIDPVEKIASLTPKKRQTLMFSATLKGPVLTLSKKLLCQPIEIAVKKEKNTAQNIEQRLHYTDNIAHKHKLLDHILQDPTLNYTIVFTGTKRLAAQLVTRLFDSGHKVGVLHGDLNQSQRNRTLNKLRQGKIRILVATDVAARGIDIQAITHVINFDLPNNAEDYVHRIGRTGRAGNKGVALSFATAKESKQVKGIERYIGKQIAPHTIPGLEPKAKRAAPHTNPGFKPKAKRRHQSKFRRSKKIRF